MLLDCFLDSRSGVRFWAFITGVTSRGHLNAKKNLRSIRRVLAVVSNSYLIGLEGASQTLVTLVTATEDSSFTTWKQARVGKSLRNGGQEPSKPPSMSPPRSKIDPIHSAVHEFNFPRCATICADATEITGRKIRAAAGLGNTRIDAVDLALYRTPDPE